MGNLKQLKTEWERETTDWMYVCIYVRMEWLKDGWVGCWIDSSSQNILGLFVLPKRRPSYRDQLQLQSAVRLFGSGQQKASQQLLTYRSRDETLLGHFVGHRRLKWKFLGTFKFYPVFLSLFSVSVGFCCIRDTEACERTWRCGAFWIR